MTNLFKIAKAPDNFTLYLCVPYDVPDDVDFDVALGTTPYLKKHFLGSLPPENSAKITRRPEAEDKNIFLLHEKKQHAIDAFAKSNNNQICNIVRFEIPAKDFLAGPVIELSGDYIHSCQLYYPELDSKTQFKL